MTFNYYESNIKKSTPLGTISLERFIKSIRSPKKNILSILTQIPLSNDKQKSLLKNQLYSFTPCVLIEKSRSYASIKSFTGLLVLDFDKIDNATEFKNFLFNEYDFIIACWLSVSKKGVRALVKIPICQSVDEFKLYFNGIAFYHMEQFNGFDTAPKNPVLPLFISYDIDILYRENYTEFSSKYSPIKPTPTQQYFSSANPTAIEKIISSAIRKINSNGHPQLRAASYALGGYVGAGYIDFQNAENLITNLINSNSYLSQKPKVYERTAKEMIIKGASQPLYLKK